MGSVARPVLAAILGPLTVAALAGCGAEPLPVAAAPPGPTPVSDEAGAERVYDPVRGIGVTLPPGWRRAARTLTPRLASPHEILSVGTGPLRPQPRGCNHMPGRALDGIGPGGAFLSIQELDVEHAGDLARLPARRGALTLDRAPVRGWVCARSASVRVWWITFRDGERAFSALAALGARAPAARRRELLRAMTSLELAPGRTASDGGLRMRVPAGWVDAPAGPREARGAPAELRVASTAGARLGPGDVRIGVRHLRPGGPAPASAAMTTCAGARACAVESAVLRGWRLRVVVVLGPSHPRGALTAPAPRRPEPAVDAPQLRRASAVLATLHTEAAWPPG